MAYADQLPTPSADTAIAEARDVWLRGYRDAQAAGREIPVVDVPRDLGDVARIGVEATQDLAKLGNRRSYTVGIDLATLERQRRERDAQYERAAATRKRQRRRRK